MQEQEKPGAPALPRFEAPAVVVEETPPAAGLAELSTAELVRRVKPAVVMVRKQNGVGTGFMISPDGLLVTNAHVVAGRAANGVISSDYQRQVVIRFADGREAPGIVVAFNPKKDLALIQLPPNPFGWPSVPIGDSALSEGEQVVAIGYPLGLPFSVSRGIVSGVGFRDSGHVDFIQHDAAVNPGNSGGPVFNAKGEVIGVNSQIMTQGGGFDGISYAISAADLKAALRQFSRIGNISSPWMGAIFYPGDPTSTHGAPVEAVRPGSPADKAGLRTGDVIVGIDGRPLKGPPPQNIALLRGSLRGKIPTDTMTLQVARGGQVVELSLSLRAK
ncbi:S1C family serine protease [Elusimicrobiota bacterium]